ncbi:RrF2 family transcriptional regulator [Acrocarpospora corrugata]|nr:Rrf2 family transcriptional regulator [Acrocarpospora corrugata]
MSEGVEWALHCCLNLAFLEQDEAVPAVKLAAFHELPTAYLTKQLQALVRAGIASSVPGPRGGFRLARAPEQISLLDVVVAIEGTEQAFRCEEIRQRGPGGGASGGIQVACTIDVAMRKAELAWRQALAAQTIADIAATVGRRYPSTPVRVRNLLATAPA